MFTRPGISKNGHPMPIQCQPAPAEAETGHSNHQWQRPRNSAVGRPRGMPSRKRGVLSASGMAERINGFVIANPWCSCHWYSYSPWFLFGSNQFWDGEISTLNNRTDLEDQLQLARFRGSLHKQLGKPQISHAIVVLEPYIQWFPVFHGNCRSLLIGCSGVATIQQIIEWSIPFYWLWAGSRGFKQMMLSSFPLSIIQHIQTAPSNIIRSIGHSSNMFKIIKHHETSLLITKHNHNQTSS